MPYKNKEAGKQYLKEYYLKNKDKLLARATLDYKKNTQQKIENSQKNYYKNRVLKELPSKEQKAYWESQKGKTPWNKGLGNSTENHRIRNSIEMSLWREAVFARDNWTCQKTEIKGGELHAHHIKNFSKYPELRFAIDNGITLCKKAHQEFHKKYSTKNNTQEQLFDFIGKEDLFFNPSPMYFTHT